MRKIFVLLLLLGAAAPLAAMFMIPEIIQVPVERLVANLERLIAASPQDVQLRLNLARLYAMAFARDKALSDTFPASKGFEQYAPDTGIGRSEPTMPPPPAPTQDSTRAGTRNEMLRKAISAYREALALKPEHRIANLGLAWCLEQSGDRQAAISAYRRTVDVAFKGEQDPNVDLFVYDLPVTEEAAGYLISLLDPVADKAEIETLRGRITEINKRGRAITPVAVPLRDGLGVRDILDDGAQVKFDADGSGVEKRWTWITANAGWLVFDRGRTGKVRSGLQLFGSVTWWLFWQNGYDALQALDDDFDRTISGHELDGLAIWCDQNGDGVSQPGEVQPLSNWRIVALSYEHLRERRSLDGMVYSPRGVTFEDGSTRPTFDLILHQRPTS